MAQTSILGRIGQLVRANVNAMLDQAEDPEKMLDQLIRDFTNNIAEAEEAVAQTVGNLRLLEDDAREAREAAGEWLMKAKAASDRAEAAARRGQHGRGRPLRRPGQARAPPPARVRGAGPDVRHPDRAADRAHRQAQGRPQQAAASSARSWSRSATSWSAGRRWPRPRCRSSRRSRRSRSSTRPRSSTGSRSGSGARRRRPAAWRRSGCPRSRTSSRSSRAARTSSRSRRGSRSSRASQLGSGAPAIGSGETS